MKTETARKYAMTKISAGSYLLPSNDGQTLWHITSFVDGFSGGLDEPDRTYWMCLRFLGTYQDAVRAVERDIEDFGYLTTDPRQWRETDSYMRTRAEAIRTALS